MNTHLASTAAQQKALRNVQRRGEQNREQSIDRITAVLKKARVDTDAAILMGKIRHVGRATINFHPDRLANDGRPVAKALLDDGVFKTQFETGISNGGLNRIVGGKRDLWEQRVWGDVYLAKGVEANERPKYGGLNLVNYADGACPRFGSCHLRLKTKILERSSFSFGDTTYEPKDIGTLAVFEPVLAALLESIEEHGMALARKELTVSEYVSELLELDESVRHQFDDGKMGRALDDYIEAQIHSGVYLDSDIESLVADPSFKGTETGSLLEGAAKKYGLELHWHDGFELTSAQVPADFRLHETPALAEFVIKRHSQDGQHMNAAAIGEAAVSAVKEPGEWREWGEVDERLQQIKYLWHTLVVYGQPRQY